MLEFNVLDRNIANTLFERNPNDSLEYLYCGVVDSDVVENVLSLAETNLSDSKERTMIRKKVYFVMVECLQNITRHQEIEKDSEFDQNALFILKRKPLSYSITSANLIKNEAIEDLRKRLDFINSMDADQLKDYARQILNNGSFSEKGGAGLGLVEMARKSGSKFYYDFVPFKYGMSIFYLTLEIPISKEPKFDYENSIVDEIIDYHNLLRNENVALRYSGLFTQGNLKNLMTILARQIKTSKALRVKINSLMIEMLQNIVQHATRRETETESACYGMFVISQDKDYLKLTSANFVDNKLVTDVSNLLNLINNANKEERMEITRNLNGKGQGLATIINKSRNKYDYYFNQVNEIYSLYSINAYLNNEIDKNIMV